MGTKEFKLPDVGEGVAEGELVSWLVEAGDAVTEDQPVAEVETDKALVEVPSPYNGTVKELFAEEGEIVPVGNVIISFEVEGEGDEVDTTAAESEVEEEVQDLESDDEAAEAPKAPEGRVFAPPSARRLARELGVDITDVSGTGPGGRISDADVRAHAKGGDEPSEPAAGEPTAPETEAATGGAETAPATSQPAASRQQTLAVPATRRVAQELGVDLDAVPTDETRDGEAFVTAEQVRAFAENGQPAQAPAAASNGAATEAGARVETVPYRGVRRTIGNQMAKSKYTAPHVTHHDAVVIDELVDTRRDLKEIAEEKGTKLTYMAFVMKAIVAGLKEYPILNSELDEEAEEIRVKNYYNIGIAVATDAGLMVPVVKDVDKKGLLELADEVNDLASRARDRKITREEMQGGTFTITNFGAIGGEYATPIINVPETAILGLGGIEQRPVVQDGEVVAAHTLPLSLTIDHRVIDGAEAAAFTNTVMEYLENPTKLLL